MPTSANSPSEAPSAPGRDPEVKALALRTLKLVVDVERVLHELEGHMTKLANVTSEWEMLDG